jgi:hypothetical protein
MLVRHTVRESREVGVVVDTSTAFGMRRGIPRLLRSFGMTGVSLRAEGRRPGVEESSAVSSTPFVETSTAGFLDSLRSLGMTKGKLRSFGMTK